MKKKSVALLFTMLLVLAAFLAGCGGDKDKDADGKDNQGSGSSSGGTLVFARGGDSTNLDPAATTEGEAFRVTKNIFDTLIDFGDDNTELVPGLATEWKGSEDGLTYTLKLREGVKFQDGTDFNAEAVKINFDRWKEGGADKKFDYYVSQFGDRIEEVKVVDPNTVEFKLNGVLAPFLKNLAMSPFAIASPAAIEKYGDKLNEHPVGTGPFKFKEWKRNDKITLVKNETYWKKGLPKLDSVIFKVIPENSARLNALKNNEADIIEGVNYSDMPAIEGDSNLQIFKRPSFNTAYLGLTNTRGPLKDKLVRQALNYAVDKSALIDAFYSGAAEPAINPMPPVVAGYNKDVKDYEYNPEKAKELLKQAGYEKGFSIELWAMPVARPYMPDGQKVAEAIQADFAKVGVKAKIVSYEWATYLDKAAKGDADAFLMGWTGDNGDADNFLYVLLDQDTIGTNNYARYSNPKVHELLTAAQKTIDDDERDQLYKEAQVLIKEDAPWIPLVHSTPLLAGSAKVKNFIAHPTGSDFLEKVEIQK
ncbi:ABC transporter substrate-binding protein [Bacillus testis]|uniref:ABC transporter substrate-binding protein n=1 Tax=Bacillus testis TaxID=1622072 RepID=UPI00067F5718|nr:ABC transporter substrate-binding protein [Bacillus testis]